MHLRDSSYTFHESRYLKGIKPIPKFTRINHQIRAAELRVIGSDGSQLGILTTGEALARAREEELDLVEVGPNAQPPVAKIIDFKKFKYEKAKAEREAKKKTHETEVKEFKIGPFIGKADLDMRIRRMKEFLEDKDRVKFIVRFPGRSITHPELGFEKINEVAAALNGIGHLENEPRRQGKQIEAHFVPEK